MTAPDPAPEARIAEELARVPDEPLLPVEKRLIVGSLVLGLVLLGILVWISYTFFPVSAFPISTGPLKP
jgi:hypothetical protein